MLVQTPLAQVAKEDPSPRHFSPEPLHASPFPLPATTGVEEGRGLRERFNAGFEEVALVMDCDGTWTVTETAPLEGLAAALRVVTVTRLFVRPKVAVFGAAEEDGVAAGVDVADSAGDGEDELGAGVSLPPEEALPLEVKVTELVCPASLSPLQFVSWRSSLPGFFPAHFPPYSTESPGFGKTTSSPSTVLQVPAPNMLASKIRGTVRGAVEELSTLTAAQFW